MIRLAYIATFALVVATGPRYAAAHGTPILVGLADNALTADGGLADGQGYAPQISVQEGEDGDPFTTATLPTIGSVIIWQPPGFQISGLNNSSSLSIEIIARPVKESSPAEDRVLWYWNPQSEEVELASADFHLIGIGPRFLTLSPDDEVAPPPFLLASNLTGHQNRHNHDLLSYALENNSPTAAGAYGFFARMLSSQHEPSNPFLVVFNHGVEYGLMPEAALAINAAAAEPDSLAGDFNGDGIVNAADYVVWSKGLPTDGGEYSTWRSNFGRTLDGEGGSFPVAATSAVPEPTTVLLSAWAIGFVVNRLARRRYCKSR